LGALAIEGAGLRVGSRLRATKAVAVEIGEFFGHSLFLFGAQ
jgi:hypothetical protein